MAPVHELSHVRRTSLESRFRFFFLQLPSHSRGPLAVCALHVESPTGPVVVRLAEMAIERERVNGLSLIIAPQTRHSVVCTLAVETLPSLSPAAINKQLAALQAGSPLPRLCVIGKVANVRTMRRSTFLDLVDASESKIDGSTSSIQVVVSEPELKCGIRGLALSLLLRRHSGLNVCGTLGHTRSGQVSLFASSLGLDTLPPDPSALLKAARLVACSALSMSTVAAATGAAAEEMDAIVRAIIEEDETGGMQAELEVRDVCFDCEEPALTTAASLARQLSARMRSGCVRSHRPPRFSATELGFLDGVGARWSATDWRVELSTRLAPESRISACLQGALDPENGLPADLPAAESEVRRAYLREKKVPQLRWMLWHVEQLLAARSSPQTRILDLGCGKGDLALLLAASMPERVVFGIDTNKAAIAAARSRAAAAGLSNAHFTCGDARTLLQHDSTGGTRRQADSGDGAGSLSDLHGVDALVALHACGGLSDTALAIAAQFGASALVCSCCFNKHRRMSPAADWGLQESEKDVLCRMADCMDPTISAEARRVISGMRLARASAISKSARGGRMVKQTRIYMFPEAFSRQNFVLAMEYDEI